MKRTRTRRLARLWAALPYVGKHIAERFSVRRARLYVLKSVEVGFGCVRLPGDGHEGTKAIAWLSVDGRSADVYPWTPERYDVKATRVRGGSPRSTAEKIAAMFSDAPKVALHVQTTLFP